MRQKMRMAALLCRLAFTSAEGEEPGYTPPEMVEYQGKTYVLAEKDVQINASEAPAGKEETVHYDGLTEKLYPIHTTSRTAHSLMIWC